MPNAIPCSVNMLTRNSERTLDAALRSVADFAEVIIGDGASTDSTLSIAARHGCRVVRQDAAHADERGRLRDYAGARSQLLAESTCEWILYLDSDEALAPGASAAIAALLESGTPPDVGAYRLSAQHVVDGALIEDGIGYPMRMQRLFRRDALEGFRGFINEQGALKPGYVCCDLHAGFLIPLPPLRSVLRKWARYLRVHFAEAREQEPEVTARQAAARRSAIRWVAKAWVDTRRRGHPHRMPARYEAARLAFTCAQYGAVVAARESQRLTRPR